MKTYDVLFHEYAANTSARAAQRISRVVRAILPVTSVLDVGCAYGTWLQAWRAEGVEDVMGVDGPWVDTSRLQIPTDRFVSHNLDQPFALGRRFDLVESLEVAEHLPASRAATFIDNLTAHGDAILFSAAPPGQGGENHVNERPYDYWRGLFRERGLVAVDCVRPLVAGDPTVSHWYRYNVLLYLRPEILARTSVAVDVNNGSLQAARENLAAFPQVAVRFESAYELAARDEFDIVFSLGVIHHLEHPELALRKMREAARPGGKVLIWVYGYENMEFYVRVLDPVRRFLFSRLPLPLVRSLAHLPASVLYLGLRLGMGRIEYFRLLRRFDYRHTHHIVFDQMIPRIANYWRRDEVEALMKSAGFEAPAIASVNNMSWCALGIK